MISLFAYAYESTALPASVASMASGAGSSQRRLPSWGRRLAMYHAMTAVAASEVPMSFRKKSGGASGSHGANAVHWPATGCENGTVSIEQTIVYA